MEDIASLWEQALTWLQETDPVYLAAGGGGLVLLIGLIVAIRMNRSGQSKVTTTPALQVASFQIAPLGRDAYLKLRNDGEQATMTTIAVKGRRDVVIKNDVAGQVIPRGGTYSILFEASGQHRLEPNFTLELTYVDQSRRAYQQVFGLDPISSISLKKISKGR